MSIDMNLFPERNIGNVILIDPTSYAITLKQPADYLRTGAMFTPLKGGDFSINLQYSYSAAGQGASGRSSVCIGKSNSAAGISATAIGNGNSANAANSVAIGDSNTSSGQASIAAGSSNTASGNNSIAIGASNVASGVSSVAYGSGAGTFSVLGRRAHSSGSILTTGDAQASRFGIKNTTSDATPTVLTADSGTASATNTVILQNNNTFSFMGQIVVRQTGSTVTSSWKFEGLIQRGTNAASTTLVTSTVTAISNATAIPTPAFSANTTLGCLALTVTGVAATSLRWVAFIDTVEVIYT